MILTCSRKHDFQDRRYGKGRRVHNETATKQRDRHSYRCTVCGLERYGDRVVEKEES